MLDVFPFLLWKILTGTMFVLMLLAPLAFCFLITLIVDNKIYMTIAGIISMLAYGTYVPAVMDSHLRYEMQSVITESWEDFREDRKKGDPVKKVTSVEIKRYKLLAWNPPKHFYVTLQEVGTGRIIHDVYVSKHCNAARSLVKGEDYNIKVVFYSMSNEPNKIKSEFSNLYSVFCE